MALLPVSLLQYTLLALLALLLTDASPTTFPAQPSVPQPQHVYGPHEGGGPHQKGGLKTLPLSLSQHCPYIHTFTNGLAFCDYNGCALHCSQGYWFQNSDGQYETRLDCNHATGQLTHYGRPWSPHHTICEAICEHPCENGGICEAPGRCRCRAPYSGVTCSEERMQNDQPKEDLQSPLAQRRVECEPGTSMPDGSTSVTLTYRDNNYFFPDGSMMLGAHQVECKADDRFQYHRQPMVEYVPTVGGNSSSKRSSPLTHRASPHKCSPPCNNGGTCVFTNMCTCPPTHWGPRCQVLICPTTRFTEDIHATVAGNLRSMKFTCLPGRRTSSGSSEVNALCVEGVWRLSSGVTLQQGHVDCRI